MTLDLDEAERRANHALDDQWCAYHDLARAVLAMASVVRAAEALRETWSSATCIRDDIEFGSEVDRADEFIQAVDAMRNGLAK